MTNATYIPLDAKESAFLEDSNTLLPKAIYKRVAEFIRDAIRTQPAHKVSMNESRSHHAISIDGERGTGKTSVLVNLKRYLIIHDPQPASRADMASEGLPRLHAPIQPTCS